MKAKPMKAKARSAHTKHDGQGKLSHSPQAAPAKKKGMPMDTSWHDRFLEELREQGTISTAANNTGRCERMVYDHMVKVPGFAAQVKQAKQEAVVKTVDRLESKLRQLAGDGNVTAVIFALKKLAPDQWGDDNRARISGDVNIHLIRKVVKAQPQEDD